MLRSEVASEYQWTLYLCMYILCIHFSATRTRPTIRKMLPTPSWSCHRRSCCANWNTQRLHGFISESCFLLLPSLLYRLSPLSLWTDNKFVQQIWSLQLHIHVQTIQHSCILIYGSPKQLGQGVLCLLLRDVPSFQ